jgi:hypothetical protein
MTDDLISRKAALILFEANEIIPTQSVRSLISALPAADTSALGAVVKPLVWVQSGGSHVMDHECHTVPTGYTVRFADENGWKWTALGMGAYGWEPSPTSAKLAAQADYTARILAALEPPDHAAQLAAALALPEVAALVARMRKALGRWMPSGVRGDGLDAFQVIRVHTIASVALEAKP